MLLINARKTVVLASHARDRHAPRSRLNPCTTPARPVMTERATIADWSERPELFEISFCMIF